MPACRWECRRSWPPIATRSCRCPKCAFPWAREQGPYCIARIRALSLGPCSSSRRAAQVLAAAYASDVFPFVDNQLAAREYLPGVAGNLEAFEHGIVDAHVMRLRADEVFGFGIPHHDVGIATRRDGAFLRIHPKDARRRRGGNLDKTVQREL